jgi:hypothetical protein
MEEWHQASTLPKVFDLRSVKTRLGIPSGLGSCHTGEVAGYVLSGHVPATAVNGLLNEKPKAVPDWLSQHGGGRRSSRDL